MAANFLYMSLIATALMLTSASEPLLRPLPDGLLIESAGKLAIETGRWTVLITLQSPHLQFEPKEIQDLHQCALTMMTAIDDLNMTDSLISDRQKSLWTQRLRLILAARTDHFQYQRRPKRGLLNAGGKLLDMLFGVVTHDEFDSLKAELTDARRHAAIAHHNVERLVTVVNQSRIATQENRERINRLTNQLRKFQKDYDRTVFTISSVTHALLLDETLALLETAENLIYRELHSLETIQNSLEDGRLAENIFPLALLDEVIQKAQTINLVSLPREWYYRNVRISTLLISQGWYTYSATLPFIGHDTYIRYSLRTWPVPVNQSSLTARLLVEPDIAFNTARGHLFVPAQCNGFDPTVCRSGPIYTGDRYRCERGLITSHQPDTIKCQVKLEHSNESAIYDIGPSRFIISTLGDAYTLSCQGHNPAKQILPLGTYIITLPDTCTLKGSNWNLNGEFKQLFKANLTMQLINIEHIDLPQLISQRKLKDYFNFNNLSTLGEVDLAPEGIYYDPLDAAHHLSWTNIILLIIIIICILCLARYVWTRRTYFKNMLAPAKPKRLVQCGHARGEPEALPMTEVTTLPAIKEPTVPLGAATPFCFTK